jgi:Quinohemoprotein amine dehydrogenase A, alpha subunit, haem binding.
MVALMAAIGLIDGAIASTSRTGPTVQPPAPAAKPVHQAPPPAVPAVPTAAPDIAAGKALFQEVCTACHDQSMVTAQRKTREDWAVTVDTMIGRGAPLTPEQAAQVVDYLNHSLGADAK